jgi:hypothetical protein
MQLSYTSLSLLKLPSSSVGSAALVEIPFNTLRMIFYFSQHENHMERLRAYLVAVADLVERSIETLGRRNVIGGGPSTGYMH